MKKAILTFGVVLLIGLALATCSNPVDILASITTEVKSATGKFLVVKGLSPSSPTNVNPAVRLRVEFDRPLNMDTVHASSVIVQKSDGSPDSTVFQVKWEPTSDHRILYVWADPYMGNATDYTLTITKAVLAADGGDLQQEYSWQFKTGTFPAGNFDNPPKYSKSLSVPLSVKCNIVAAQYRIGYTPIDYNSWTEMDTWTSIPIRPIPVTATLSGSDEPKTVYVQFIDGALQLSLVQSATIVLDTHGPVLTPATLPATITVNKVKNMVGVTPITAADALSGYTFHWAYSDPVTVSSANALNATTDGSYPISLAVTDGAGNTTNGGSATLIRDTWLDPPSYDYVTYGLPYVLWSEAAPPVLTWYWKTGGGGETPAQFRWKGDFGSGGPSPAVSFSYPGSYKPDVSCILVVTERDNALNSASTEIALTPTSGPVAPPDGAKGVLVPKNFSPASTAKVLQWRAVKSASYYIVSLRGGPGEKDYRVSQLSGDPFLPVGLGPEYEYSWRIVTYDIGDKPIVESPTYYFTTIPIKS